MEEKVANIDYICVIVADQGKTLFKTIDIPDSSYLVSKLEKLAGSENATLLDMESRMNAAFIAKNRATLDYVIPTEYDKAYIDKVTYPKTISYREYKDLISQVADGFRKDFLDNDDNKVLQSEDPERFEEEINEYVKSKINDFKNELKKEYLITAGRYIYAYNYTKALNKVMKMKNVTMYSTSTLGWSKFDYKVTDDITIKLRTNFGYGSASYFTLCLEYKGIDILPYSYMVKYYYADMRDLLRYTRLYDVAYDSWNIAFAFVEETANLAASSSEEFVSKWILNEVREMVHGLKEMQEQPDTYINGFLDNVDKDTNIHYLTVRNMISMEAERFGVYPTEMSLVVRAEKVTGALDFLTNLALLANNLPEINLSIGEIKDIAVSILPELTTMIEKLTREVAVLQEKKSAMEAEFATVRQILKPQEETIDNLYENRAEDQRWFPRSVFEKQYAQTHREYAEKKAIETEMSKQIFEMSNELLMRSYFLSELKKHYDHICSACPVEPEIMTT